MRFIPLVLCLFLIPIGWISTLACGWNFAARSSAQTADFW
ncbi:hypothetical protein BD293_4247 [Roseinatronobacter monicus]|uniref:Uncharacterized protein n=1 Tax=Roseinatronobacter monicus TaxID=393481 RepID=A0A543K4C2_9RHOB|nr:hypothetical protein BD293_4247 [Roseinatronobacter monicus]